MAGSLALDRTQSSGIAVNPQCLEAFQELKLKKRSKFIIYKLGGDLKEIVVEKTSDNDNWEEFVEGLPEAECRYAVYDFHYEIEEGHRSKIIFLAWYVRSFTWC